MSHKGVIAAGHPQTLEAARLILEAGGNAFDAALAALCAACVSEPVLASLGGGGFLMATRDRETRLYDFFAQTPKYRRPMDEVDFHPILADFGGTQQEFHIGLGSMAVPGVLRGLFQVHRELGSIPMQRLVEPAVALARDGIVVNSFQSYLLEVIKPIYSATPEMLAVYGSAQRPGDLLAEGELFRLPAFADALEILAVEGDRLFYEGEMGHPLIEDCRHRGGYLGAADLADYRVLCREPLAIDYRGGRLLTNPPPSSGGILIGFALRLLEAAGSGPAERASAEHLGLLATVMELTNRARVESNLRDLPHQDQAGALLDPALLARYRNQVMDRHAANRGTTHISVIDGNGHAASLTVSNGEGVGYLVPGTGIMMNNMLGEEDINPHGFHNWPVDSRIASMMAPSVLRWPDGRIAALGSGGSNRIRTAILQVLVNLLDFELDLEQAVEAPRIHHENRFLNVEGGCPGSTRAALAARFPEHRFWDGINFFFGGVHCVMVDPARDQMRGAGDPRRGGVWTRVA
jgi:gamma-glutamyltranspeptidase/glutathione hydrolase